MALAKGGCEMTGSEMLRHGFKLLDKLQQDIKHPLSVGLLTDFLCDSTDWAVPSCRGIAEHWKKTVGDEVKK